MWFIFTEKKAGKRNCHIWGSENSRVIGGQQNDLQVRLLLNAEKIIRGELLEDSLYFFKIFCYNGLRW